MSITISAKIIQIFEKTSQNSGDKYLHLRLLNKNGVENDAYVWRRIESWRLLREGSFYDFKIEETQSGFWRVLNWNFSSERPLRQFSQNLWQKHKKNNGNN